MGTDTLVRWLDEHVECEACWFFKRLSADDTFANGPHANGIAVPLKLLKALESELYAQTALNPELEMPLKIDSHSKEGKISAVWLNGRLHKKGNRNEARLMELGETKSALRDPESTGALVVFAFVRDSSEGELQCRVWVCDTASEEDVVEQRFEPIEPGAWLIWSQFPETEMYKLGRPVFSHTSS